MSDEPLAAGEVGVDQALKDWGGRGWLKGDSIVVREEWIDLRIAAEAGEELSLRCVWF